MRKEASARLAYDFWAAESKVKRHSTLAARDKIPKQELFTSMVQGWYPAVVSADSRSLVEVFHELFQWLVRPPRAEAQGCAVSQTSSRE
jgi:hypothetical protein